MLRMTREQWDTLARRVKGRRLLLKLSQEQLAVAAQMSQSDISKIERGDMQQTSKMAQLARGLGCDAYWLATGEGEAVPEGGLYLPPKAPTVQATLDQLAQLLSEADEATRGLVADMLQRYAQNPADGERIARAIEVLLSPPAPRAGAIAGEQAIARKLIDQARAQNSAPELHSKQKK